MKEKIEQLYNRLHAIENSVSITGELTPENDKELQAIHDEAGGFMNEADDECIVSLIDLRVEIAMLRDSDAAIFS